MTYIVTGANGFIGAALLRELSAAGEKIYAVVRNEKSNIDNIKNLPGVEIVCCDMAQIDHLPEMLSGVHADCLIHLAWAGTSGDSRADYEMQLLNIKYALDTVDVSAKMGIRRFVGAGTLAEKDVLNYQMDDGATPNAVSIYGIAKLSCQLMTKAECSKLGMEHLWCHLPNTYGVGNTTNNFVNMAAKKILGGQRAAFTEAKQTYDFVYITDTARAIAAVARQGKANTAYYLGSGAARPLRQYIEMIRDAIDPAYSLYFGEVPFNGKSLEAEAYSTDKLYADTGFEAQVSFEDGIRKTVAWLKEIM